MYSLSTYLFLIIGAALSQNIVLTKGVYVKFPTNEINSVKKVNLIGLLSVIISLFSAFSAWLSVLVNDKLFHFSNWTLPVFAIMAYSLLILLFCGLYYGVIKPVTKIHYHVSSSVVFGFLPIAVAITVAAERMPILDAVCYGLGSGIGVWVLLILNHFVQRRLEESSVPTYYRGIPVTIFTLGIVSMAIFGLLGHGITL